MDQVVRWCWRAFQGLGPAADPLHLLFKSCDLEQEPPCRIDAVPSVDDADLPAVDATAHH